MIKKLKIRRTKFTFVFRHRWEQDKAQLFSEFSRYELGLWYKRNKMVGAKDFQKPDKWSDNLVNQHMIGINLVVCKAWVSFHRGGMEF